MYGGEEICIQDFGGEALRERDHLENADIHVSVILRWIFRKNWGGGHALNLSDLE